MPSFAFSLQRVLDYRRLEETWAQEAYRLAQAARIEAEEAVERIRERRQSLADHPSPTLAHRMEIEAYHVALDREEESARNRVALLTSDETRSAEEWRACRSAAETLEKLREAAYVEWQRDEARREQAELDEWAVLRR